MPRRPSQRPTQRSSRTTLAAGTNSAAITPANNKSVLVMGCTTSPSGDPGVGQASLLHLPSNLIMWAGLDSANSNAVASSGTSGFSGAPGTHMVWIDDFHEVDIQVASADTIQIHNGAPAT